LGFLFSFAYITKTKFGQRLLPMTSKQKVSQIITRKCHSIQELCREKHVGEKKYEHTSASIHLDQCSQKIGPRNEQNLSDYM
jgi:hypothetical protein